MPDQVPASRTRIFAYATLALIAFAANSVLCRLALRQSTVDPASFSTIRLASGAATLLVVGRWAPKGAGQRTDSWKSAGILALYAVPFSFAYASLTAGTGALILFGCVQVTMVAAALRSGERPHPGTWFGLSLAMAGLVYLVLPGLAAPPLSAAALMGVAGVSWGMYSLHGRNATNPLAQNTMNFVRAVPLVIVASLATLRRFHVEPAGALLAMASGSLASGLGYVVWYAALRGLTAVRASVLQLAVPVLAALGGVVFLAETVSARLILSAIMVLGGIAVSIVGREILSPRVKSPAV